MFFSIELAFMLKFFNDVEFYPENKIHPKEVLETKLEEHIVNLSFRDSVNPKLILIGDSFLYTDYLEDYGYIRHFEKWTKANNYELINLAGPGISIQDNYSIWPKIPDHPNHTYIFSIKIHDIETKLIENQNSNQNTNTKTVNQKIIQFIRKTEVIYILKDILHQAFMYLFHTPAPKTHISKMILYPDDDRLREMGLFLSDLDSRKGKVLVLVNYPFNFKYSKDKIQKWKLFKFFDRKYKKLKIYQTPLFENRKESINWRDAHPNSVACENMFKTLIKEIERTADE